MHSRTSSRSWWTLVRLVSMNRSAPPATGASSARSSSTRLAEALQQDPAVGLQKQGAAVDAAFAATGEEGREVAYLLGMIAGIDADSDLVDLAELMTTEFLRQCIEQADGEVVDTVVAHILQCVQGDAFAGAGQATDDHQVHSCAFSRRRFCRSMNALLAS
jgi:hypothetical protein